MSELPRPPKSFQRFSQCFPKLREAWDLLAEAGEEAGPLDRKTQRLVKLAVAAGSFRVGAVHSSVRKARAAGATAEELDQVVALAASTLGLPSAVAIHSWILEELEKESR